MNDDDGMYRALLLQLVAVFEKLQAIAPTLERDEALQRLHAVHDQVVHSVHVDTATVRDAVQAEARRLIDDIDSGSLGTMEARLLRVLAEPDLVAETLARSDRKTVRHPAGIDHSPPPAVPTSGDPSFGVRLQQLRLAAGMSLSQLAMYLNYSKSYLSKVENGTKPPSRELKERIAALKTALVTDTVDHVRPVTVPPTTAEPDPPRTDGLTFQMLGAVEARIGDQPLPLGPPMQQSVLARLLMDAGRPVTLRSLIEAMWGDEPPEGARGMLYAHLTRIRRLVEQPGSTATLTRNSGGYVLDVDPDQVDLHRFHRLIRTGYDHEKPEVERATLLHTALSLWRGVPLTGASGQWVERLRANLVQERLDTSTTWAELTLRLGRPLDVISTVRELVTEYPLAESLVAALMRALTAARHSSDALALFEATRTRLADELSIRPGPELRATRAVVLRGGVEPKTKPPTPQVPRQLPANVYAFVGREHELSMLDGFLSGPAGASTTVVVGTAGIGKTALAVHWAHRVRDQFPDGQLFLDLRGYDSERPMSVTDALARLLTALGLPGSEIPPDPDARAARYRAKLSNRRMLVLLDNAATTDQVRPLLPDAPGCQVLVTSRDSLAGLIVRDGARRLALDLLPLEDAVRLLGWLIGDRVTAEPAAAERLARECARLPLALRIAAELAADRPHTPLSVLVDELADEQQQLALLNAGADPSDAVHAVTFWSYQHLTTGAARLGDVAGQANAHSNLGIIQWRQGNLDAAVEHLEQALDMYRRLEDQVRQAQTLGNLGLIYLNQGRFDPALDLHEEALALFYRVGDQVNAAYALNDLAAVQARLGRTTEANSSLRRALYLFQVINNQVGEAMALNSLGQISHASGMLDDATDYHTTALTIATKIGDHYGQARAHAGIATIHESTRNLNRARTHWQKALDLYTALEMPDSDAIRTRLATLGTETVPTDTMVDAPPRRAYAGL